MDDLFVVMTRPISDHFEINADLNDLFIWAFFMKTRFLSPIRVLSK